jgi:hypothetical protein
MVLFCLGGGGVEEGKDMETCRGCWMGGGCGGY